MDEEQKKNVLKQLKLRHLQEDSMMIDRCPTPVEKSYRQGLYSFKKILRALLFLGSIYLLYRIVISIVR